MRTTAVLASIALVGLLALTGSVRAEEKDRPDKTTTIFRSVDLIGKEVRNPKGEALGQVEDYVINMANGQIAYVAMSHGETLGFGGKLFALPPNALKLSDDWKTFVLNVNKDEMDRADGFDANKWPTSPDNRWARRTATDGKPAATNNDRKEDKAEGARLRRMTSLMGLTVKNQDGETLGSSQGFGVDLMNDKIVYLTLAYGGVAGIGSKYFAIPWNGVEMKSFDLKPSDKTFVIHATRADFENQPGFEYKKWPNEADARFAKDGRDNTRK